jgi:seryl-tRNA synthetase
MASKLKVEFLLSGPVPAGSRKEIVGFIEGRISAVDKEVKADAFKIAGSKIEFSLSSPSMAHTVVLRVRKPLAEFLGKKYKTGLRSTAVRNYEAEFETDRPEKKFDLPFCKKITLTKKGAKILFEDMDDLALNRNYPNRIIKRFKSKTSAQLVTGKAMKERTVRKSKKKLDRYAHKKDITDELIKRGWLREFGSGVWTVMPPFAALIKAIQDLCIDEIAKPLGFHEVIVPRLIPLEVQRKKGQLSGIPNEIFWVCPPASRDPAHFDKYRDLVEITGETHPDELKNYLREPFFSLSYAQCEPFYDLFGSEIVDADNLPFKFYDINGPTWRWEGGGLKGYERLNEFLRIELFYVGTKEQITDVRNKTLERSEKIMEKVFDIQYRIDANAPVYLEHAGKAEEESEFVKTYDLVAILPFITASRDEAELEIASYHAHTDFYMDRFHIKERKNREIWTGCAGIGPSRWAYVFLQRWGFDYKKWPKEIKKYIGPSLPDVPRMVTWPKK